MVEDRHSKKFKPKCVTQASEVSQRSLQQSLQALQEELSQAREAQRRTEVI